MKNKFSSIESALQATAEGRVLIVVDSEDREDEGDFFVAADGVTPEAIHFMISEGRGQLCMPVMPELASRLSIQRMESAYGDADQPRFAIPLDHLSCRSGISPTERAYTIRAMVDENSRPEDFQRPGHIFPLIAESAGVFARTGHTEAAVDLSRLAGLSPAGVLCEICSRDGREMAGRQELHELAQQFKLPIITIDHLIEYRTRESTGHESWDVSPSNQAPYSTGATL